MERERKRWAGEIAVVVAREMPRVRTGGCRGVRFSIYTCIAELTYEPNKKIHIPVSS